MKLVWTSDAREDYLSWHTDDPKILRAINELIKDMGRHPFQGLGKPEPLKFELKGWCSRRITLEHRLVYRVAGKGEGQQIEIVACRYHY